MSINSSYNYYANPQGDAHLYYAQYKNNSMKKWRYLRDSGSYDEILQDVKESQNRAKACLESGEKYYKRYYKTMIWRILKVDIEILPI